MLVTRPAVNPQAAGNLETCLGWGDHGAWMELSFGKTLGSLGHWSRKGQVPLLSLGAAVEGQGQSS